MIGALLGASPALVSGQTGSGYQLPKGQTQAENELITQAQAALDAKQWQQTQVVLKQLIGADPKWPYYHALALAQLNLAQYENALASYDAAIDLARRATGLGAVPADVNVALGRMHKQRQHLCQDEEIR